MYVIINCFYTAKRTFYALDLDEIMESRGKFGIK